MHIEGDTCGIAWRAGDVERMIDPITRADLAVGGDIELERQVRVHRNDAKPHGYRRAAYHQREVGHTIHIAHTAADLCRDLDGAKAD